MNRCPVCESREVSGNACLACGFSPSCVDDFDAYAPGLAAAGPGYDPQHYANLAQLESGNFWFKARNELILWAFGRFFPRARSYLEVGCGTGYVLAAIADAFPGLEVHGSEIFVEGLGFAKDRVDRAHLFQMDARHVPYDAAFDVIGAFDVIEHIDEDVRVLEEMHRALHPGGGIILTVPQHDWLWSSQDEVAHHVRRYSRDELVGKVRDAGFRVEWTSSFVSLLLPAMAAARFAKRGDRAPEADVFSEFKLPRAVDAAMFRVMQAEIAMIRAGARFPVGGSRILVAYRKES